MLSRPIVTEEQVKLLQPSTGHRIHGESNGGADSAKFFSAQRSKFMLRPVVLGTKPLYIILGSKGGAT